MTKRDTKGKPKSSTKRPADVNQLMHFLGAQSTKEQKATEVTEAEMSRVMSILGRKGGKIGGRKRAEGMTAERRREIALKAARSRWDKPNR